MTRDELIELAEMECYCSGDNGDGPPTTTCEPCRARAVLSEERSQERYAETMTEWAEAMEGV